MEPGSVALALTILGITGLIVQFTFYPSVNSHLGNVRCFRIFCILFPVAYCLAPFLVVVSSNSSIVVWLAIVLILTIHTTGRIFVLPATIALLNNCVSDPSMLGTIHGIGQTTTALFRTLGPVYAGYTFGVSLGYGFVGIVWWIMATFAIFGWFVSLFIWERPSGSHRVSFAPSVYKNTILDGFKTN